MFVAAARHDARIRARELRAAGLPLRAIAHELGAALSSVSVWVRDVQLSEEQNARLRRRALAPRPPRPEPRALPSGTKRCPRCARDLPFSSFSRDGDGWQSWCKRCFSAYFAARREHHLATMKRGNDRRRSAARGYVRELRAKSACADCGLTIPECLEFDHVAEKTEDVSRLIGNGARVERLRAEIAFCEIVCACCHRRRTHRRQVERASRHAGSRDLDAGRTRNRVFVQAWASLLGCADCGERDPVVLDYDHVDAKREHVSTLARHGVGLGRLFEEMLACEIRCANCHRRRHRRERASGAA